MKWLVTVSDDADLSSVGERLRDLGCDSVDVEAPVPLSGHEVSITVEGPAELPKLVKGDEAITGVFNNSDIVLS